MIALWLLALVLATPGPTPSPAPLATPSATPAAIVTTPVPDATPLASPLPSETPNASPSAIPSQWPTRPPLPAMNYKTVPKPAASADADGPVILEVDLNERVLHGTVAIRVLTSENVVKVISGSMGRSGEVPQVGPGDFEGMSKIPKGIPLSITLAVTATSADGRTTTVKVPVRIR